MKRATKRILFVLAFVVGLSYFAFTLVFFDPFEGSYMDGYASAPVAIEYVVPRNVDFFVHKRDLAADIPADEFPVPAAWDRVRLSRNWQRFQETELYRRIVDEVEPEPRIEQIRESARQVPLLEPLADLLGRDAAVFGRLGGRTFAETEVCATVLGSRMARFAYEAAGQGWLRMFIELPFEVEVDDYGVRKLTFQDGRTLFVYRHLDLFVAGSGPLLVREVVDLLELGREKSLGYSRRYHETVAQDVEEFAGLRRAEPQVSHTEVADRLQLYGGLPALFSLVEFDDRFLEHQGRLSRWLLARLFNPRYYQDVALDVGFGDVVDVRGTVGFNREAAEAAESGFYNRKTFELRAAMDRVASLLPSDTWFVMAARLDLRQFLPKLIRGLEEVDPAAKELLDELVQAIRKYRPDFRAGSAMEAARQIASFLGDDVVVALKRDTYFGEPQEAAPLLAIFLEVQDRGPDFDILRASQSNPAKASGYNGFIYPLQHAHTRLRQEGRGVVKWYNVFHGGQGTPTERYIQDVYMTGTGVRNVSFGIIDPQSKNQMPWTLAITVGSHYIERESKDRKGETDQIGTAHELMTDIIALSSSGGKPTWVTDTLGGGHRQVDPLVLEADYERGRDFLGGHASAAIYLDASGWKRMLIDNARAVAERATEIDWQEAGAAIEEDLLSGSYASWRGRSMPADVKARFQQEIEDRKRSLDQRRLLEDVPRKRQEYEENLAWIDLLEDAFVAARIDEQSQNIEVRAKLRTNLQ